MTYIYLDTETTGFGKKDVVIQLAFIVQKNGEFEAYETLCRPPIDVNIKKGASEVHGLYKSDVAFEPLLEDTDAYKKLLLLNRPSTICFIHNAMFDIRLLKQSGFTNRMTVIDTLAYARKYNNTTISNKLQEIRKTREVSKYEKSIMEKLGIEQISAHDALGDVVSLASYVVSIIKHGNYNELMEFKYTK